MDKDYFIHGKTGLKSKKIKPIIRYRDLKNYGFKFGKYYASNYIMYRKEYLDSRHDLKIWKINNAFTVEYWEMWTREVIDYIIKNYDTCFKTSKIYPNHDYFSFTLVLNNGFIIPKQFLQLYDIHLTKEELIKAYKAENTDVDNDFIEYTLTKSKKILEQYPILREFSEIESTECYITKKAFNLLIEDLKQISDYFKEN